MKGIFWKVFSCFPISNDGLATLPTHIGSFLPVPREIYFLGATRDLRSDLEKKLGL